MPRHASGAGEAGIFAGLGCLFVLLQLAIYTLPIAAILVLIKLLFF